MRWWRRAPKTAADAERAALVAATREWGYFTSDVLKRRRDVWGGRHMLEVGMGAGPHSVSYVEAGAASYVGVDPLVGSEAVRDFRSVRDRSLPEYHAFPFGIADIERLYPNIRLYPGLLEDVADRVAAHRVDVALMSAVTEHLKRPQDVMGTIWRVLDRNGLILISHSNYYAWSGHHRAPRSIEDWDRASAEHHAQADWRHLEPTHPAYADDNLNRMRLEDFRDLVDNYFEIVEWRCGLDAQPRLTPALRRRWRRYELSELLGRTIYVTGKRRDEPRGIDLSHREFFHPSEAYLADRDYSGDDIAPYLRRNSIHFVRKGKLVRRFHA